MGPSGCGKTTLLRLIAGILRPASGRVVVGGEDVAALDEGRARAFRLRRVGLVFQEFELLDYLSARDNILLPYRLDRSLTLTAGVRDRLASLAEAAGIAHLLGSRPPQLSRGERQRVAVCRALITRPGLVLADEPTASLDPAGRDRVVTLLRDAAPAAGAHLVVVTHDPDLPGRFGRVVDLPSVAGGT